jgi:hypothetical protein
LEHTKLAHFGDYSEEKEDRKDDTDGQLISVGVGASLTIFLGFTFFFFFHHGFHSVSTGNIRLALKSWKLPASSAMFSVTVTTLCWGFGDKLCKYLTQLLTQIGAQGFEKLSPLSPLE